MEASALAHFWAGVIALAIVAYTILDGFDLGVGILFGFTRDERLRARMIHVIAPFWDGNETWLVVIGAGLYATFPAVYSVLLGALYIPMVLLLVGLIFRGIAFEFRSRQERMRPFWDWGFFVGSTVVGFVQGAAIGTMLRGIPVDDRQFAGTAFDWVAPLPVLTGVGLVVAYALLGAGWLVLKGQGELRDWAYVRIPWLAVLVIVLVVAVTLSLDDRAIAQSHWGERPWGVVFPVIGALAVAGTLVAAVLRRDRWPFAMGIVLMLSLLHTLAVLFWPHLVPYALTVADAASPDASLSFFFWGAGVVVLPIVAIYTTGVYWVFRGKTDEPDVRA